MFDSCSSGPRVILIHDSYFLAPSQALSVCEVRGCESTSVTNIALLPLRPGMPGTRFTRKHFGLKIGSKFGLTFSILEKIQKWEVLHVTESKSNLKAILVPKLRPKFFLVNRALGSEVHELRKFSIQRRSFAKFPYLRTDANGTPYEITGAADCAIREGPRGDSGEQEHKGDRVGRNSDWSPHLHL